MTTSPLRFLCFALLFAFIAVGTVAPVQAQIYVDKDATGAADGTSWTDAYTDLQTAIDNATGSDEIWIAEGVYVPSTTDETVSFTIPGSKDGLKIYGGFESGDTFSERDPGSHPTVLSGDVGGDDNTTDSGVTVSNDDIVGINSRGVLKLIDASGGALTSSTVIDGVTITGGDATNSTGQTKGGGLYCDALFGDTCNPTLRNVVFAGNQASEFGGAIYNVGNGGEASPTIINAVFVGNAADAGGAITNRASEDPNGNPGTSSPSLINVTFTDNRAIRFSFNNRLGGAMLNDAGGTGGTVSPTITNTILWGNSAGGGGDQIYNLGSGATPKLAHTIIEGGISGISENSGSGTTDDGGNLNQDPQFDYALFSPGGDGAFATDDDGLHVRPGSPAIDAGDGSAVPSGVSTDLTGASRTQNGTVDIGAYEGGSDRARTLYVDASTSGTVLSPSGASWGDAFPHLQDALAVATGNDEIWVAEGTYTPDPSGTDELKSFRITGQQEGLEIYGGFTGGESSRSGRDPTAHPTILSGDLAGDDNTDANGVTRTAGDISGDNSNHVFFLGGTVTPVTIDGFVITGGQADGSSAPANRGGGLYCDGADNRVCNFRLENVVFAGNRAGSRGGALYSNGSNGASTVGLKDVVFASNSAGSNGGALYVDGSNNGDIDSPSDNANMVFTGNSAGNNGGAVYTDGSDGGTIRVSYTQATFVRNSAGTSGGAFYEDGTNGDIDDIITASILWGNTAGDGHELYNTGSGANPALSETIIEDGPSGISENNSSSTVFYADDGQPTPAFSESTNFDANPRFFRLRNPAGADGQFATSDDGLQLLENSPALDAGLETGVPSADLIGGTRIEDQDGDGTAVTDLGAYEGAKQDPERTIYVDASSSASSPDGTSWSSAFPNLQDALAVATGNDEIWIAEGVYTPDPDGTDEFKSFRIPGTIDGLKIYGGFAGGESNRSDRDPTANPTVLSGDLAGDDNTDSDGVTRIANDISGINSHTVLHLVGTSEPITQSTVIDGVVVTGGQADGQNETRDAAGGALFCDGSGSGSQCNPELNNLVFAGNTANEGGAIYNDGRLGGLVNPLISRVTFTGNSAAEGGAVYSNGRGTNSQSDPKVVNTVFANNSAAASGGAVYSDGGFNGAVDFDLSNTVFSENEASTGGALYVNGFGTSGIQIAIGGATFVNNAATGFGSVSGDELGGAIYVRGNQASSSITATVLGTILWGNTADVEGSQIYGKGSAVTSELNHSIIQGGPAGISNNDGSSTDFLDGSSNAVSFDASTNLNLDPLFADVSSPAGDDGVFATDDDGLHVVTGSPAIDAGTDGSVLGPSDVTGATRVQNGTVDIGAYEGAKPDPERVLRVDASSSANSPDGTSWSSAFPTLQDALAAATGNDEIWIAEGVYTPDPDGTDESESFRLTGVKDGLKIYGGFAGDESNRSARDPTANPTVLSGDLGGDDNTDASGVTRTAGDVSGDNSNHVLFLDGTAEPITSSTVIDGVAVTGGQADLPSTSSNRGGGGLYCDGSGSGRQCGPTLRNVVFAGNSASSGGSTSPDGGAIYYDGSGTESSPRIEDALFTGNTVEGAGGVISAQGNIVLQVLESTFTDNEARRGGAIHGRGADLEVGSTNFVGNVARLDGGALFFEGSSVHSPRLYNVTLTDNRAARNGGALFSGENVEPYVFNTILWGNTADADGNGAGDGGEIYTSGSSVKPTLAHTIIEGGVNGSGVAGDAGVVDDGSNLDANPQFADPTNPAGPDGTLGTSDDRLVVVPGSPAIDNGSNEAVPSAVKNDVTGAPRVQNNNDDEFATVNVGAYEIISGPRPTVATGAPTATSDSEADFAGTVNPSGTEAAVVFEYRQVGTSSFDSVAAAESPLTGSSDQSVSASVSGLDADTEYEVRVAASNVSGTSRGELRTFVTPPPSLSSTYTRPIYGNDGTGNDAGWRMLALPAAGATRAALDDDVEGQDGTGPRVYRWQGDQWTAQRNASDPLPRGSGFVLYFFDDAAEPLTSDGITLDVDKGIEDQQADETVSGLGTSNEFFLLGNPYDVAYDLGSLAGGDLAGSGFQATVQVWNPLDGRYEQIVQGGTGDEIPAWQSFFVQRSSVGAGSESLTFAASGRQSTAGDLIGSETPTKMLASRGKTTSETTTASAATETSNHAEVALDLSVEGDRGATVATDRATYWIDDRAQSGYDAYEAEDLPPPTRDTYATVTYPIDRSGAVVHRSFATVPHPGDHQRVDLTVPVSVRGAGVSGTATLSWPDRLRDAVPDRWAVRLHDTETGTTVSLRNQDYTFDLRAGESISAPEDARFKLTVGVNPIPVEMASFTGRTAQDDGTDGAVHLQWKTASEQNNAGFIVQRKEGGTGSPNTWDKTGFVESRASGGTTSQSQRYRFADTDLPYTADSLSYRLVQVDLDGTRTPTDPVTVVRRTVAEAQLLGTFPNPARRRATVRYAVPEARSVTLRLYDTMGRRVRTLVSAKKEGRQETTLDVSDLSSGVYFLRLRADGTIKTQKLTVVR